MLPAGVGSEAGGYAVVVTRATPRRPARRAASLALVGLVLAVCAALLAGCGGSASTGEREGGAETSKTVANAAGGATETQAKNQELEEAKRDAAFQAEMRARQEALKRNEEQESAEAASKKHAHKAGSKRGAGGKGGAKKNRGARKTSTAKKKAASTHGGSPAIERARKSLEAEEAAEAKQLERKARAGR